MFRSGSRIRFQSVRQPFRRRLASLNAASIEPSKAFEEETLPHYSYDQFYPVHVGQHLGSSYKVVGKLGYGAYSTVWLCRDMRDNAYVTIKVCTRTSSKTIDNHREIKFYEHLISLASQHRGSAYIRDIRDTFEIDGPDGHHLCLVHSPMHMTIRDLQYLNPSRRLPEALLRCILFNILQTLSFLHEEAQVIHADINPSNIMLTIEDHSLLEDVEKKESMGLSPKKVIHSDRTIYGSHKLGRPKDALWGQPVLCDFGEARIGPRHKGLIQPQLYRAPEVVFEMDWDSKVDIWSISTMIWDLFGTGHLSHARDEDDQPSATHHVAEMVSLLGLPSTEYLQRSDITKEVFDDKGNWKGAGGVTIPKTSLEELVSIVGPEDEQLFLEFVRKMLHWLPEQRKQPSELLKDPWLTRET